MVAVVPVDCPSSQNRPQGFSLIELLVVVVVVGILSAIAYPSYIAYKTRANRAAVQGVLMDMANKQQQYFLDSRSYTTSIANLGYAALPVEVANYYAIAATNAAGPPPTYSITATPIAGTSQVKDGSLVINGDGTKTGKW